MKRVCYRADFSSCSGYARAARAHARALIEAGVELGIDNHRKDRIQCELDPFWRVELGKRTIEEALERAETVIWHETPEFYDPRTRQRNIAYVAWETSKIPSTDIQGNPKNNWVKQLNRMDQVWVPCTHNREVLKSSGVTKPIEVVPHPVSVETFSKKVEPLFPKESGKPTFLSVFQWHPRKDPLSLLLGFYQMKSPAKLLIKTYVNNFQEGQGEIIGKIRKVREAFHVPQKNMVSPVFQQLSDEDMVRLYASADAIVSTSRGEGFCLPIVEGMAAGLVPIAPNATAFRDFFYVGGDFWPPNCWNLGYSEQPVYGMHPNPWYSPDQRWMQVNVDDLVRGFEAICEWHANGMLMDIKARARETVRDLFHPEKIGAQMKALLA